MQAERVVEVTFENGSAGSGYLITPRHVLTTRHVVEPRRQGTRCTVRLLVTQQLIDAQVEWFAPDKQESDLDVAIIQLNQQPDVDLEPGLVPFGAIAANDIEPHSFLCVGFPVVAGTANLTVTGTLAYVPGPKRFDLTVYGALPRQWRKWAGLSGAVVFCGERAVGVVRTVKGNFDRLLTATPVQLMIEHNSFQAYWQTQKLPNPIIDRVMRYEPTTLERISDHVYLIDRKDPVESIKRHLQGLPALTPSQIIVIPGLEDDEHKDVIRQLSEDAKVQHLLGREAKSEDVIVLLPWPLEERRIDSDERFRIQLERICATASVAMPFVGQLPDLVALRTRFDQGTTPRGYWTLVSRKIAFGGHSRLLRLLIDFWESLGTGLPVLLFLCVAWDKPEQPRQKVLSFLREKPLKPEKELEAELLSARDRWNQGLQRFISINELEMITSGHIDLWIDELRSRCRTLRPGQLTGLRISLLHRIGPGKRARQVAAELGNLLHSL